MHIIYGNMTSCGIMPFFQQYQFLVWEQQASQAMCSKLFFFTPEAAFLWWKWLQIGHLHPDGGNGALDKDWVPPSIDFFLSKFLSWNTSKPLPAHLSSTSGMIWGFIHVRRRNVEGQATSLILWVSDLNKSIILNLSSANSDAWLGKRY